MNKVLIKVPPLAIILLTALSLYACGRKDTNHFAGTCTEFSMDGSGEDIQIDRDRGLAYISLYDRQGLANDMPVPPGDILALDLTKTPLTGTSALIDGPELRPHGLSLFIDQTGQRHLFVINHPEDRATGAEKIERYLEVTPGAFRHVETFTSPLITRANDLAAVGGRQFYVAQDVDRSSDEKLTSLVYFDGENYAVVADDIQSGGGINASADHATLYISETNGKTIRVASRDVSDGSITTLQNISLGTSPDNIDVAADGSLWVGAHSRVLALVLHFITGSKSPTQILRIDLSASEPQITEMYLNDGEEISAGSCGATYGSTLLMGSITAKKLLVCEMD
jgi:arylesterase / paraoxonase